MRSLFAVFVLFVPFLALAGPIGSRSASSSAVDSSGNSALNITAPTFIATDGTTGYKLKASSLLCYSSDVSCSATAGATAKYNGTDFVVNVPTAKGFKWTVNGTNELTLSTAGALVATGAVSGSNLSGTNTGDITVAALGAATANGASLSGQALSLTPADATHPGVVTNGTQTLGSGTKTVDDLTATNTVVTPGLMQSPAYLAQGAVSVSLRGLVADGATAISIKLGSNNALSNAGAKIVCFYSDNNTTLVGCVDVNGIATFNGGLVLGSAGTKIPTSFQGSAVIDFASTSVGACATSTVTVTGAALGDACSLGISVDMSAILGSFECRVTGAGTAKVVFCPTAATQDPASATYYVRTFGK